MRTVTKKKLIPLGVFFIFLFAGIGGNNTVCAEPEEMEHRNKLGVFGGITQENSDLDGSLGLEYEYLFIEGIGVGGILEFTSGGVERSWLAAVPLYFHPYDEWFIVLAPGIEFEGSEGNIVLRAGVGYDFEFMPQWSLAPQFNVDFLEGDDTKLVYGFAIVYSY